MTLGIISDTHGLLRPSALDALHGSSLILHAGDVGSPDILSRLREISPVTAVRGNIDTDPWAATLPLTTVTEAGPLRIYMLHNLQELDLDPAPAGFHAVIYGHSHKASRTERAGVVYLNPGSAGPRRFRLPITLARLEIPSLAVEFVELS